ncbi:hypothetical protein BH18ACT15_BH18ACT15_07500 [soil metagenome]
METAPNNAARGDWEQRIGRRSDAKEVSPGLPAPCGVRAEGGVGQVTVQWQPVPGAMGYLVYRAETSEGPFQPVDHGGGDVLAVPGPRYADTTGEPGRRYWYRVASLPAAEARPEELSPAVESCGSRVLPGSVRVFVDARSVSGQLNRVWRMIGSERLSQLRVAQRSGGLCVGDDFKAALELARRELGATHVRAHAILHDDLGIIASEGYDFKAVDEVYDRVLALDLKPVVELSFMPGTLASDPEATVFDYRGIISPPRDWGRWGELCGRLTEHLVARYGAEELGTWGFEVWNEANLEVFWTGTQEEYFRLYEEAARSVKAVDHRLLVGGPATAAAEWLTDFLDYVHQHNCPLDFVSLHTYGNIPLDVRAVLEARDLEYVKVWWTEWGVTPTHFLPINDSAFAAPFVLHGMKSAQKTADALAYWVVSDHFEELGRPERLLHGGFGLLTVGNLRKPRYWALKMAEGLGDELLVTETTGDGAGSLVDAWAARGAGGVVDLLLWNGTLDQSKSQGDPLLARKLKIMIDGLSPGGYEASIARIDVEHSNIAVHWNLEDDWPTPEQWAELRRHDKLDVESLGRLWAHGSIRLDIDLPMPGVARLRLRPC